MRFGEEGDENSEDVEKIDFVPVGSRPYGLYGGVQQAGTI